MSHLKGTLELFWSNPHILEIVQGQGRAFIENMGPGQRIETGAGIYKIMDLGNSEIISPTLRVTLRLDRGTS